MENYINCIYMYINKNNGKKYVGQTIDFNRRHKQHIRAAESSNNGYDENAPIHRAMRKYGIDNFEIIILKQNLNNQDELDYWECYYIKEYNTLCKDGMGYNLSSGGAYGNPYAGKTEEEMKEISKKKSESRKGMIFTEEHKKHISENSHMKNIPSEQHPFYGKHHTEEANEKNRQAHLGKHHTEETKKKIGDASRGGNNPKARKIYQYDLNGNFIACYDSIVEAAASNGFTHTHGIIRCAKGQSQKYRGFVWRYNEIF